MECIFRAILHTVLIDVSTTGTFHAFFNGTNCRWKYRSCRWGVWRENNYNAGVNSVTVMSSRSWNNKCIGTVRSTCEFPTGSSICTASQSDVYKFDSTDTAGREHIHKFRNTSRWEFTDASFVRESEINEIKSRFSESPLSIRRP